MEFFQIPKDKIFETKKQSEIPPIIYEYMDLLKFKQTKNITENKAYILGSYTFKSLPFPSDIDMGNLITFNLSENKSAVETIKQLQHIIHQINQTNNIYFTDMKAGYYDNGEAIHWTSQEIMTGKRSNKPDLNGQSGQRTLIDAVKQKPIGDESINLIKIDIVVYYLGRYMEVTMAYIIKTNDGYMNINEDHLNPEKLQIVLKRNAKKYYDGHKYLKTIKRIFSQAKIKKDYDVANDFIPLLSSNVAKLSMIESDLKTLELLMIENKKLNMDLIHNEISYLIEKLSMLFSLELKDLDVDKLIKLLLSFYKSLKENNVNESFDKLKSLIAEIHEYVNKYTLQYLDYLRSEGVPVSDIFSSYV